MDSADNSVQVREVEADDTSEYILESQHKPVVSIAIPGVTTLPECSDGRLDVAVLRLCSHFEASRKPVWPQSHMRRHTKGLASLQMLCTTCAETQG